MVHDYRSLFRKAAAPATPARTGVTAAAFHVGVLIVGVFIFAARIALADPPGAPARPVIQAPLSPAVAAGIARAVELTKAKQFDEGLQALDALPLSGISDVDRQAVDLAHADAQYAWGMDLIVKNQFQLSQNHFLLASGVDQRYPTRRQQYGNDLRRIAATFSGLNQYDRSIELNQQALAVYREIGDLDGQGNTLNNLGTVYRNQNQPEKAIEPFRQALQLYGQVGDQIGNARTQHNMAFAHQALKQYTAAIDDDTQALAVYRELKDKIGEASALDNIGISYANLTQFENAIGYYTQAVLAFEAIKDQSGEAYALNFSGLAYANLNKFEQSIDCYERSLPVFRALKDKTGEASALNGLATASINLHQTDKAIAYFELTLPLFREQKDAANTAFSLNGLGAAYAMRKQYAKAIASFEEAIPIFQARHDGLHEAYALNGLGLAYYAQEQYPKAIDSLDRSTSLSQALKDGANESKSLSNLGLVYMSMKQYEKALACLDQALAISRAINDKAGEAAALSKQLQAYDGLAGTYERLSQYDKAVHYLQLSLPILRELKDQHGIADLVIRMGAILIDINQYEKAIELFDQALPIYQTLNDRDREGVTLSREGNAYLALSKSQRKVDAALKTEDPKLNNQAIDLYERALLIFRQVKDRDAEAYTLNGLGIAYKDINQGDKATAFFEQSMSIFRELNDRVGEEDVVNNLADTYNQRGRNEESSAFFNKALFLSMELGDKGRQASGFGNLMRVWGDPKNPHRNAPLAILLGKESVNLTQQIRGNLRELNGGLQKGFFEGNSDVFYTLFQLLVENNRLPEALEVLNQARQEEYLNYYATPEMRQSALLSSQTPVILTPREAAWSAKLQAISVRVAGPESDSAPVGNSRPAAAPGSDEQSYAQYVAALDSLVKGFRSPAIPGGAASDRLAESAVPDVTAIASALRHIGPGTAAVYTVITEGRVDLLLVTGDRGLFHVSQSMTFMDFAQQLFRFSNALRNPHIDPRPEGHRLYNLLLKPLESQLAQHHIDTLMLSLDHGLDWIPVAALYDGHRYVAQKWRTSVFTPGGATTLAALEQAPTPKWRALAVGVSKAHDGSIPLPGVPAEVKSIVKAPESPNGLLGGKILLDDAFTQSSFLSALHDGNYSLVHVASHFNFSGNDADSYLLLGDGTHLTLEQLRALPDNVFAGIDLVTLSACQTGGPSDTYNGPRGDVENFAVLAQRKGAGAVLASLWSIEDSSTGVLMQRFYAGRLRNGWSKSEALRQAQIALLTGDGKIPLGEAGTRGKRGVEVETNETGSYVPPAGAPFAHPYYWAPFLLIGNAR